MSTTKTPPLLRGDEQPGPEVSLRATVAGLLAYPLAPYYILLGASALLLLTGLVMVWSASGLYADRTLDNSYAILLRQVIYGAVALPVAWLITRQPPDRMRRFGLPMFLGALALLVLTFVPGFGAVVNGSRNWLDFGGPFNLQPSEFAKFALIVWGASVYARKGGRLVEWQHLVWPFLIGAFVVIALTVGQRDLGTAAITTMIVLAMLWVVGVPGRVFALGTAALGVLGALAIIIEPYRVARLTSFLDPFADPLNTGYQAVNSIYAFASGGWWGSGLGAGRQKWGRLPEAHTDFIYAVIGEELGLVGSLAILFLILCIGYAGIRIAMEASDRFVQLLAAGMTAWLLTQYSVNIGGALGVLPITGVPLPLVSYGGSSLIITLAAIAVLLAAARAEPAAAEVIRTRSLRRSMRRTRRGWNRRKG